MIVGVDATNLLHGGGRTHLVEVLRSLKPNEFGIKKVIVWGRATTLSLIDDRDWIVKLSPAKLNGRFFSRTYWQLFLLSSSARREKCDILLIPGGSYFGTFRPYVVINQTILPFDLSELCRYGFSLLTLKLFILRYVQRRTISSADGVIFLSNYAKKIVENLTGPLNSPNAIIPHGVDTRFSPKSVPQLKIENYKIEAPYRLLYVSTVDCYKHQWNVVEAVSELRISTGWPIVLKLVGAAYPPALRKLNKIINKFDPCGTWVSYHSEIDYNKIDQVYRDSDMAVWASTCEAFGMILVESMAAGLPIASSDRGTMTEILRDAGVYFNPELPSEIKNAIFRLISSPELRDKKIKLGIKSSEHYNWNRCSSMTFEFVSRVFKVQSHK